MLVHEPGLKYIQQCKLSKKEGKKQEKSIAKKTKIN